MQKTPQFCQAIHNSGLPRANALVNLVIALATCQEANSVVSLSNSPLFTHQYSSIADVLANLDKNHTLAELQKIIVNICLSEVNLSNIIQLSLDVVPIYKPFSPTLEDRQFVYKPNNNVPGNKPLEVGYNFSCLSLHTEEFVLPLYFNRVTTAQNKVEQGWLQLEKFAQQQPQALIVSSADSDYNTPLFLAKSAAQKNLLMLTRCRYNRKIYQNGQGNKKYGKVYYLNKKTATNLVYDRHIGAKKEKEQESILDSKADEEVILDRTLSNGRAVKVHLYRWNDHKMRSKGGHNMKEVLMDIVGVFITDAISGNPVFDRPLFISACGEHRCTLSIKDVYEFYLGRTGIEQFFRFSKQELLLNDCQSSNVDTQGKWVLIVQLAAWLLYSIRHDVCLVVPKWQQYLPSSKAGKLSLYSIKKSAFACFVSLDLSAYQVKTKKGGIGRPKGYRPSPRTTYKVVKKGTKSGKSPPVDNEKH